MALLDMFQQNPDIAKALGINVETAREKAFTQGLLSSIFQAAALSGPQPRPVSTAQALGQVGLAGMGAYESSFDKTLKEAITGLQVKEFVRKQKQEEGFRDAVSKAYTMRPSTFGAGEEQQKALMGQMTFPGEQGAPAEDVLRTRQALLSNVNLPQERVLDQTKLTQAYAQFYPTEYVKMLIDQGKMPEAIRTLEILGSRPDLLQLKTQIASASAPQVNMGVKPFAESFEKKLGDLYTSGISASRTTVPVQTMIGLLDEGVQTGFGQEFMLKFQQAGQLFNPNYNVKNIAGQEAFIGASNEIILPLVKQLGVNPTDADLNFIKAGSPTLSKSVEGNRLMLEGIQLKLQRDQALSQFASKWQSQNVSLIEQSPVRADAAFKLAVEQFIATNPLFTTSADQLKQRFQKITGRAAGVDTQESLRSGGLIR